MRAPDHQRRRPSAVTCPSAGRSLPDARQFIGGAAGRITARARGEAKAFVLSRADYLSIQRRVHELAGIRLGDQKFDLVYSRLTRRLRALGLDDFASYLRYLDGPGGEAEFERMLNALTTNLTSFFREAHHFDHLKSVALKPWLETAPGRRHRLRLWSSACSTGEEPCSMAMTLLESGIDLGRVDARILATDLNTEVLEQARIGHYDASAMAKCPAAFRRYFQPGADGDGRVTPPVRDLIRFRQLNLLDEWPMKGPFDVVFCRNVLIYFDGETKRRLVDRFVSILQPGGWLYLGHSESASGSHPGLDLIGQTIYRRRCR